MLTVTWLLSATTAPVVLVARELSLLSGREALLQRLAPGHERREQQVGQRPVLGRLAHLVGELAADEGHLPHRRPHRPRADLLVLGRQAVLPDVGRLDDVVIDGDDFREVPHG